MSDYYLHEGLAQPAATDLDKPYWDGLSEGVLRVQRCNACQGWQWGAEWICHHCHSDDLGFVEVDGRHAVLALEYRQEGRFVDVALVHQHRSEALAGFLLDDCCKGMATAPVVANAKETP